MGYKSELVELFGRGFDACGIVTAIQVGRDGQAGFGGRSSDEVEDFLVTVEWFTCPVLEISEKRRCSIGFHLEAPVG